MGKISRIIDRWDEFYIWILKPRARWICHQLGRFVMLLIVILMLSVAVLAAGIALFVGYLARIAISCETAAWRMWTSLFTSNRF